MNYSCKFCEKPINKNQYNEDGVKNLTIIEEDKDEDPDFFEVKRIDTGEVIN